MYFYLIILQNLSQSVDKIRLYLCTIECALYFNYLIIYEKGDFLNGRKKHGNNYK